MERYFFTRKEDEADVWQCASLFDSVTLCRYRLMFRPGDEWNKLDQTVFLYVESVSTPGGEYDGGLRYTGQEALDFWRLLSGNITEESRITAELMEAVKV